MGLFKSYYGIVEDAVAATWANLTGKPTVMPEIRSHSRYSYYRAN